MRDAESVSTSSRLTCSTRPPVPSLRLWSFRQDADHERCVNCDARLDGDLRSLLDLYRIDQVSTRRADRITSDEEERQRQGYEVITTLRFAEQGGRRRFTPVTFTEGGECLLSASYGPAATVWRINLGWRRRKNKSIFGFNIDVASGEWSRDEQAPEEAMEDAPTANPCSASFLLSRTAATRWWYVQGAVRLDDNQLTTLTYALKRGIESVFQLEENELAAEPLPDRDNRNAILLYEAAEGGAGVLSRLASDPPRSDGLRSGRWRSVTGARAPVFGRDGRSRRCRAGLRGGLLSLPPVLLQPARS